MPMSQTTANPFFQASARISSFEKKPASGGMPAMASDPTSIVR